MSEAFKENCLDNFMIMCDKIANDVKIFDYVDPSTGVLMLSDNPNHTYSEISGATSFLVND